MRVVGPLYSGAAAGSAGSATANSTTSVAVAGLVHAVYLDYLDSPPNTTDVTVATAGVNHPAVTILSIADAATDGWWYPRAATHSTAGVAALYAGSGTAVNDRLAIADTVKVTIAQANAADGVNVWLLVE